MRVLRLTLLFVISCFPLYASGEDYCAGTPAQLISALTSAAASTSASTIRVRTGLYILTARLSYIAGSDLHISGGWQGAGGTCTTRSLNPELTLLQGPANAPVMFVSLPANGFTSFTATGLYFSGGASSLFDVSSCLTVVSASNSNADIRIEGNQFSFCATNSTPGVALVVKAHTSLVYVINNKIAENQGTGAAVKLEGLGNSDFFVSNNTLAFNRSAGAIGMLVTGNSSDSFALVNNVLWSNGGGTGDDLTITQGTPVTLNSNHIGRSQAFPVGTVNIGTSSSDPGFVSGTDLRPRSNASIRDNGVNATGQLANDLDGAPRVQGVRIDRGAYEFSEIFRNGFE